MPDLVQTPNGTFVDRSDAEAAGLDVGKVKRQAKSTSKPKPAPKSTARRKATTSKGRKG